MTDREDEALARFLAQSPAARVVAGSLRDGAEVAVTFTGVSGEFRVYPQGGRAVLEPGKARDPDFELRLSPGAIAAIVARPDGDIGDLGVVFFEHIIARDPEQKVWVTLRNGLVKLTMRGWVGVVARGGPTVASWLAKKGLRGPGAVAGALAKLRR